MSKIFSTSSSASSASESNDVSLPGLNYTRSVVSRERPHHFRLIVSRETSGILIHENYPMLSSISQPFRSGLRDTRSAYEPDPAFTMANHLAACATALPLPLAGEGWGGGRQTWRRRGGPMGVAVRRTGSPRATPHPDLPRKRERERESTVFGRERWASGIRNTVFVVSRETPHMT